METEKHWQHLVNLSELEPNDVTPVSFNSLVLAVYDTVDGYFVSDARCTHSGANLCDGYFNGTQIECPLHQGLFDARTGAALAAPVTRSLRMIPTRIEGDSLQVLHNKPAKKNG